MDMIRAPPCQVVHLDVVSRTRLKLSRLSPLTSPPVLFIRRLLVRLFHQCHSAWGKKKKTQVGQKGTAGASRSGRNASNFLLSLSLNVCALSLPPRRGINSLLHLCVPPSSRSLIHLISALRRGFGPRLPSESPPPVPRSWLTLSLACLLAG